MGPNRRSDPAARPPDIGTQCSDLKFDSDGVPIYDPDPFIRVEKHALIHIIFYRFENTGRRPKQDDCMERRQRNS